MKIDPKIKKETGKARTTQKRLKNQLGEPTFGPESGFGSILGSLERPKSSCFERQLQDEKIVEKRVPKSRPRFSLKNHPKVVPGDPFWDPKQSRINVGEVKKPKNYLKKSILDTVGFEGFLSSKKLLLSFRPNGPKPETNLKNYRTI